MKKILLLSALFFNLVQAQSLTKEYNWSDLDEKCFSRKAEFKPQSTNAVKVKFAPEDITFFVQDNKIVPFRTFEYGKEVFINYEVKNVKGAVDYNIDRLSDGNPKTAVIFDPYEVGEKSILLDFGKKIAAGTFQSEIDFLSDGLYPKYFVSVDNQKFIEVANYANFDFRYMKIVFVKRKNDVNEHTLRVNEIYFYEKGEKTYLLNPPKAERIDIFAGYRCQTNDALKKLLNQYCENCMQEEFMVDVDTEFVTLQLKDNPTYNEDFDRDSITHDKDNCPYKKNADQSDIDQDLIGDVCDFDNETKNPLERDHDFDGIGDQNDNCPYVFNPQQTDSNADHRGDACADDDNDGIRGDRDNCPNATNRDQKDINVNGVGDVCEFDKDEDGIFDEADNCRNDKNSDQKDDDHDGIGNICDNCERYNPRQVDADESGVGDVCEEYEKLLKENDKDKDLVWDAEDNCKEVANPNQEDDDKDGVGNACDNCLDLQNPAQIDKDDNKVGDLCEDRDEDGLLGYLDNCEQYANADQKDADNDGKGDMCEDDDYDGILAAEDNCPFKSNQNQWDADNDGKGDACDEKDDRFFESNKGFVIGFIVFITIIFGFMIVAMIKKMKKS